MENHPLDVPLLAFFIAIEVILLALPQFDPNAVLSLRLCQILGVWAFILESELSGHPR